MTPREKDRALLVIAEVITGKEQSAGFLEGKAAECRARLAPGRLKMTRAGVAECKKQEQFWLKKAAEKREDIAALRALKVWHESYVNPYDD